MTSLRVPVMTTRSPRAGRHRQGLKSAAARSARDPRQTGTPQLAASSSRGASANAASWPAHLRVFVDIASEWRVGDAPLRKVLARRAQLMRSLSSSLRRRVEERLYRYARSRDAAEHALQAVIDAAPKSRFRPSRRDRLLMMWVLLAEAEGLDPTFPLDEHWYAELVQARLTLQQDPALLFPEDVVTEFRQRLGEAQAELVFRSLNERAPVVLRMRSQTQRSQEDREAMIARLRADGIKASAHPLVPGAIVVDSGQKIDQHPLLKKAKLVVQDAASQLALLVLDLQPGMKVVDYCAGGGGKALGIVDRMATAGELAMLDLDAARLQRAERRVEAQSAVQLHRLVHDGRKSVPPEFAAWADRVLVDAPCSGLGTVRRQPDLRWRYKQADIKDFARDQQAMTKQAINCLKPGGRLLYTTCSLRSAENEERAQSLAADSRLRPVSLIEVLPADIAKHIEMTDNYCTLWPHLHKTDGFFMALYERH